jgi:predicted RNA-binding protein with RPS1 domain
MRCWPARSTERSKFAPQIHTLQIPTDKIRDLIGPGGKTIRGIIEATGVKIDVDDTGRVNVASSDEEGLKKALAMISDLTAVPEVGKTYLGKVVRLAEFGAFVEIFPGTDGLLHISEIAEHRVKDVKDELREGDQVLVKVLGIEGNRIKLSRKALLKEQREKLGLPEPSRGGSGGDFGGGERRLRVLRGRNRNLRWNGSRLRTPAPSPSRAGKSSMTMSPLSRAGKSQTSIVRMVLRCRTGRGSQAGRAGGPGGPRRSAAPAASQPWPWARAAVPVGGGGRGPQ